MTPEDKEVERGLSPILLHRVLWTALLANTGTFPALCGAPARRGVVKDLWTTCPQCEEIQDNDAGGTCWPSASMPET